MVGQRITNLGACEVCGQGPHKYSPVRLCVEVASGQPTAQKLHLLTLIFPIDVDDRVKQIMTAKAKLSGGETVEYYDFHRKLLPLTKEDVLREYRHVFSGIGRFLGKLYHIQTHREPDIKPVMHQPRQESVYLQTACEDQPLKLTKRSILKKIDDEFTPWVNSVVTTRADGSVCI